MRTLYKEKGPRIRCEVAHRGPVIRASDRPIIPSALLTKNIMPISGRSFQTFALRVCPCLWHIFFFLLLIAPSIPSPPFISVPSLPPALPRPSQDRYSPALSLRPSTLLPFAAGFRRSLQSMRGYTGCYRNTRPTRILPSTDPNLLARIRSKVHFRAYTSWIWKMESKLELILYGMTIRLIFLVSISFISFLFVIRIRLNPVFFP